MRIDMIPVGDNVPDNINVIIEVPTGGEPVKYEFDKASGALFVDRILHTPMRYPANYDSPHTLRTTAIDRRACFSAALSFPAACPRPTARCAPPRDEHGGDDK